MGVIVRAIGAGIGFVAEATSSNKRNKPQDLITTQSTGVIANSHQGSTRIERHSSADSYSDDSDSSDSDDDTWTLDQAVQRTTSKKKYGLDGTVTIDSLVKIVISNSKPPPYSTPRLSLPVILPQRRPGARGRGFVRAYAPVLNDYNIDQDTFLTFIENLDSAIAASPLLSIICLGAGAASVVPNGWATLAGTLTQLVVGAAIEYQRRTRGHSYLDQINEQLFKPRGLYAVVMTYVPDAQRPVTSELVDINDLLAGKEQYDKSFLGPKLAKGESYGELELPESAPLVFPGIDEATKAQLLEENAMQRAARWTGDYMDRRGQARWIKQNPESRLNPPEEVKPTFKSTLADPNHPAFQGSWPTLFSGGRIPAKQKMSKDEKRAKKEARKAARHQDQILYDAQGNPVTRSGKPRRQTDGKKKKRAKSKILYLMILPIPSETELRETQQQLEMDSMR